MWFHDHKRKKHQGEITTIHADGPSKKGSAGRLHVQLHAVALCCLALALVPITAVEAHLITVHAEGVTIEAAFGYTVHGLGVAFDDRSSGLIIAWAWSFGDDSGKVSGEKNPTFEYMTPGKYTVTLRITDASGIQDQVSKTIRLGSTDTKTISVGAGAVLFLAGFVFLFRGDGEIAKFSGVLLLVVGAAFFLSVLTQRDLCGRIYDLLSNLWR